MPHFLHLHILNIIYLPALLRKGTKAFFNRVYTYLLYNWYCVLYFVVQIWIEHIELRIFILHQMLLSLMQHFSLDVSRPEVPVDSRNSLLKINDPGNLGYDGIMVTYCGCIFQSGISFSTMFTKMVEFSIIYHYWDTFGSNVQCTYRVRPNYISGYSVVYRYIAHNIHIKMVLTFHITEVLFSNCITCICIYDPLCFVDNMY